MSKREVVQKYYDSGIWDKRRVYEAVKRGWISEAEYEEITGEGYV